MRIFVRYSWLRLLLVPHEIALSNALSICLEISAVLTMWFGDWYDFYIVQKEVDEEDEDEEKEDKKRLVRVV